MRAHFLAAILGFMLLAGFVNFNKVQPTDVAQYLQSATVIVRDVNGMGTGVLYTAKDRRVYVWTAGHIVEDSRTIELRDDGTTIDKFADVLIICFRNDTEGHIVYGPLLRAAVIRMSDADEGNDIALLRINDPTFEAPSSIVFDHEKFPAPGTPVYHCGHFQGFVGTGSISSGVVSQNGRLSDGQEWLQTDCMITSGSSGGAVVRQSNGHCLGLVSRGRMHGFELLVPVTRMRLWAKQVGVAFAMDPTLDVPSDEVLMSRPIYDMFYPWPRIEGPDIRKLVP